MDYATQERSGRQDNRSRVNSRAIRQHDAAHTNTVHTEIDHLTLNDLQVGCRLKFRKHLGAIDLSVRLRTRPLYCGPFAPVQQAELDPGKICNATHHAIQGIYLTYKVPFTKSSDGWIARHHANPVTLQRNQNRPRAKARGRCRRLASRVPAPDYHHIDVRMFHVKHLSLSYAET